MTIGRERIIEDLLEQYQRQRSGLADLQRRMQAIAVTVVSPRRDLSVTVGHGGVVSDLKFMGSRYRRMSPQELSDLVLATIEAAREKAATEAAEIVGPMLPGGVNARDLVAGRLGADHFAPADGPRLPGAVSEYLGIEGGA